MTPDILEAKASIQVLKPAHEVFEAIVDPQKMANYFISQSSGRMEDGKTLTWRFPEFDMEFPVRVVRTEKDQYVSFHWDVNEREMLVEMTLTPQKDNATLVKITEKSMENTEAGINWMRGNTEGWANFLACLKAYLEYGINLRKGAFDFLRDS